MSQPGRHIESFRQAAYFAYRRVPVRWRLGGGSAALTLVILTGFAVLTDFYTDRQVDNALYAQGTTSIARLAGELGAQYNTTTHSFQCDYHIVTFAQSDDAEVRLFANDSAHTLLCSAQTNQSIQPINKPYLSPVLATRGQSAYFESGYRVNVQKIPLTPRHRGVPRSAWLVYALPLSRLAGTTRDVRIFLTAGVLGGAILALFAGLIVAQRAMRPIANLTEAAREIERTRDASVRIPYPQAEDEVTELARTLDGMLGALDAARTESDSALARQREFVADASHELRTPLTSVLANLELLADELEGEQADSANAALRSTRRMRRLVADLLLLARADVGRLQPHSVTDLADRLTDAASELSPSILDHEIIIDAARAPVEGLNDELHRLILNLLENAVSHTPSGTHIQARTCVRDGNPTLIVCDDGPGIPPELQERVFERFVRGGGDTGNGSRGTGLGLAIVNAVSSSHRATVNLESLPSFHGTQFTITFPPVDSELQEAADQNEPGLPATGAPLVQTSTTTGRTMGRRRSRS
jgi:signal transduction histidine kinase